MKRTMLDSITLTLLAAILAIAPACSHHKARDADKPRAVAAESATPSQVVGYDFDWDDNVFFMPTKIVLFDKRTGEERPVSTGEFAIIREKVGKEGEWARYELRNDPATGSFRYFRDGPNGENYFLEDLKAALAEGVPPGGRARFMGPSWDAFVRAMESEAIASWSTIITARGHSAAAMYEGLKLLQKHGYIKHLPRLENLFAVSNPKYKGTAADPSAIKAEVMKQLLDRVQALGVSDDMMEVVDPNGRGKRKMHIWGFSDDDFGNFETALKVLGPEVAKGRWPDIKITLIFSGNAANTKQKPRAVVLKKNGKSRPRTVKESLEASQISCQGLARGAL
jgi:hypothetical protein